MPPRLDAKITGFIGGNDITVRRTVTHIPATLTIAKCWLTIKAKDTDADPGLVQKAITDVLSADGQITDTGADGTGTVVFLLKPADTGTALTAGKTYVYDIKMKFNDATIATLEKGTVEFEQGVTTTTT